MRVQLLSFPGCPNADAARDALRRSLVAAGLPTSFDEIDVTSPETPEPLRNWGSPTILVEGNDVAGESPAGSCCRLYPSSSSRGAPSDEMIRRALASRRPKRPWLRSLSVLPGALLALLPAANCPFCIAAYAGVLSSLGLGVLHDESVLFPVIAVFLVVGLVSIGWSTRSHRRLGPLLVTIIGSAAVIAGRLIWNAPAVLYGGVALLVGASLWNLWLKRPRPVPLVELRLARKEGNTP